MEIISLQNENFTEIAAACVDGARAEFSQKIEKGGKYRLTVAFSDVAFGAEKYNESFLASLRENLKSAEALLANFVISPFSKNALSSIDDALEMTAAFKHCARRIKDCENVAGFEIPRAFSSLGRADELAENFMQELAEKHPKYLFFCEK